MTMWWSFSMASPDRDAVLHPHQLGQHLGRGMMGI